MKFLKWGIPILLLLFVGVYFYFQKIKAETKKASPEATAVFTDGTFEIRVDYCRPYKKDRQIFGELVPYGEVWRTGANEATKVTFNKEVKINETKIPAGTYTLWTIPNEKKWTIIFNNEVVDWGVGFDGKANRDSDNDVANFKVPVQKLDSVVEQFTINFEYHVNMTLAWDQTKVSIPIIYSPRG